MGEKTMTLLDASKHLLPGHNITFLLGNQISEFTRQDNIQLIKALWYQYLKQSVNPYHPDDTYRHALPSVWRKASLHINAVYPDAVLLPAPLKFSYRYPHNLQWVNSFYNLSSVRITTK